MFITITVIFFKAERCTQPGWLAGDWGSLSQRWLSLKTSSSAQTFALPTTNPIWHMTSHIWHLPHSIWWDLYSVVMALSQIYFKLLGTNQITTLNFIHVIARHFIYDVWVELYILPKYWHSNFLWTTNYCFWLLPCQILRIFYICFFSCPVSFVTDGDNQPLPKKADPSTRAQSVHL